MKTASKFLFFFWSLYELQGANTRKRGHLFLTLRLIYQKVFLLFSFSWMSRLLFRCLLGSYNTCWFHMCPTHHINGSAASWMSTKCSIELHVYVRVSFCTTKSHLSISYPWYECGWRVATIGDHRAPHSVNNISVHICSNAIITVEAAENLIHTHPSSAFTMLFFFLNCHRSFQTINLPRRLASKAPSLFSL